MSKLVSIEGLKHQADLIKDWVKNAAGKIDTPTDGSDGQGKVLTSKGNGKATWSMAGNPTDEQVQNSVNSWLAEHPESTTTIEDKSIIGDQLSDKLTAELRKAVTIKEGTNGLIIDYISVSHNAIIILNQPTDVDAGIGDTVAFTVEASATESEITDEGEVLYTYPITYQWQSNATKNNGTWTNIGTNSNTLSFTVASSTVQYYRCVISCAATGDTKATNVATIYFEDEPIDDPAI